MSDLSPRTPLPCRGARGPGEHYVDSGSWLAAAKPREGSWWPEWTRWLERRSGGERRVPPPMGAASRGIAPLGPAPGLYVHQH